MALELFMVGLIVRDMEAAVTFYRRLGLAVPEGSETKPHVQIKMESGLTLFLGIRNLVRRWNSSQARPVMVTRLCLSST
jgi:catechol 2,3-dioxygenase-like lactoylglutathione lyase family enzyme